MTDSAVGASARVFGFVVVTKVQLQFSDFTEVSNYLHPPINVSILL